MIEEANQPTQNVRGGHSSWFVLVVAVFITCLITANIIAVKLVSISDLVLPAGTIIFPISYIFGDVLTEVYGYCFPTGDAASPLPCGLLQEGP